MNDIQHHHAELLCHEVVISEGLCLLFLILTTSAATAATASVASTTALDKMSANTANSVGDTATCTTSNERKKFLGANWKCSLETVEQVDDCIFQLNQLWESLPLNEKDAVELCIYPSYCFIDRVRKGLHNKNNNIVVGSQNVYDATGNAGFTGSCTPKMVQSLGGTNVLIGHSDRRNALGESNALIAQKVQQCLAVEGLSVTLTIGETAWQRKTGRALSTLYHQLRVATQSLLVNGGANANNWHNLVIAYEPVWAIGDGATPCSPTEAARVHSALRAWIARRVSPEAAAACRLVYTGSVNAQNAIEYTSLDHVDGSVVGRAGLDMVQLKSIIQTLAASSSAAE